MSFICFKHTNSTQTAGRPVVECKATCIAMHCQLSLAHCGFFPSLHKEGGALSSCTESVSETLHNIPAAAVAPALSCQSNKADLEDIRKMSAALRDHVMVRGGVWMSE